MDPRWLDDAVDEAVFVDQREVEKREQKHFEQAIGQLERFVDDKVLVCRRERASIAEKLRSAQDSPRRGRRLDRRETGSKRRSCASPRRTRRSSAGSARSIPGKTRSTGNGETSITSFGTGRQR